MAYRDNTTWHLLSLVHTKEGPPIYDPFEPQICEMTTGDVKNSFGK